MPIREKIKTIIWDLDNTLYKFNDSQIRLWHEGVVRYMQSKGINVTIDEGVEIAHKGWIEHRDSNHYFIKEHDLCKHETHVGMFAHVDQNMITPCEQTPDMMDEMRNHHHVILTYGTCDWAHRVLDHTGLSQFFQPDFILGAEDYNFEDKAHSPRGILMALDKIGGNANDVLFVEDTLPNLQTAQEHTDVKTAYLHHNRPMNDNDVKDIDICVQDTPELLKWFKEIPKT